MAPRIRQVHVGPPLDEVTIRSLSAGQALEITGSLLTVRDATAARLVALIERAELPVDLQGRVLYAVGPSPQMPNRVVGSAGPTTTERLGRFIPALLEAGVRVVIGKGELSAGTLAAFRKHQVLYFAAIGGLGALLAQTVITSDIRAFPELGTEALHEFGVDAFPAIVIVDSDGNDYYATARSRWVGLPSTE